VSAEPAADQQRKSRKPSDLESTGDAEALDGLIMAALRAHAQEKKLPEEARTRIHAALVRTASSLSGLASTSRAWPDQSLRQPVATQPVWVKTSQLLRSALLKPWLRPTHRLITAAALLIAAIVWLGSAFWVRPWSPVQDMVNKHLIYSLQLAGGTTGWQRSSPDRMALEQWASEQLGAEIRFPRESERWTVEGVRCDRVKSIPAMLAFCRDRSGERTSLFALPVRGLDRERLMDGAMLDAVGPDRWHGEIRLPARVDPEQRTYQVDLWIDGLSGTLYGVVRTTPELTGSR
jgi:hypothetical protein